MNSRSEKPTERTFEDDLTWCYDAVQGVSRTFAITIDELEEPTARYICVGYLLCRVPDTVEDAGHIPPDEQAELLRTYSRVLDTDDLTTIDEFRAAVDPWIPSDETDDDWAVVANAHRITGTFEAFPAEVKAAMRGPVRELVDGMAMFVDRYADEGGLRIETIDELEEYCWYAAGTVGKLITNLVSRHASEEVANQLRSNARSFALLLQLVNVAKDVAVDYHEENNVYLPENWLQAEGVDPDNVADPENAGAVATVIRRITRRADGCLDDAQTWLEHMPVEDGNTLAAWAIPFFLAVGTLRELRANPRDVIKEGGVKISRAEVFAIIQRFQSGVSRSSLGELRGKIENEPFHKHHTA